MPNTPQHPPTDLPPGAPPSPHPGQAYPQPGSFTPAPYPQQPPPQPAYTPPGGTQQGFMPAQPPPGLQASPPGPAYPPAHAPPAPQASPPPSPPRPPAFTPSRNPIVRLILWFTEPSMLKGMAMGVILALVVGVAIRLEAMWYIVSGLLLVLFVCLFGVIIGHYVFENRRKRVQARGLEMLREAGNELPALSDNVMTMLWSRDRSQLPAVWDRLRRIRPAVEEIGGLTIAVVFRTMAMGALFAVLGAAISFAVFITSFMQVERMTEQNKLIQAQIKQTDQQMAFDANMQNVAIALSVADRRQITLRDLISDISNGKDSPCPVEVPLSRLGERKRCLSDATTRQVSPFFALLQPYKPVVADGAENKVTDTPRSPEQAQFLRYLSANNIEVGNEALDLSSAFLDHADLHGTYLERIHLTRGQQGISMRHAQLFDADFSSAQFAHADLSFAVLSRSKFISATLAEAKLVGANLFGADLTGANLAGAVLSGANLKSAVLQQAQLGRAVLHGANLGDVNLTGADLTEADLALANLGNATMPQVPKVRAAAFWWLGIYASDYAAKLGLNPEAQQRNQAAYDRLIAAPDADAAATIVQELKSAAPSAPA
jgi:uncharacterized protein YjbI with pentapeptide repeats